MSQRPGVDRLHAFVDGQLNTADKARLLEEMEMDASLAEEVCRIRRVKEYVQCAFDTVPPAPVKARRRLPTLRAIQGMAAVLLLTFGFLAGRWSASIPLSPPSDAGDHVILHVNSHEGARFLMALADAEALSSREGGEAHVDLVFNGDGLDMVRSDRSPGKDRVRTLMARYPNIRFIACNIAIGKQRARGEQPVLLPGIEVTPSAGDYILRRMEEGWSYLRI